MTSITREKLWSAESLLEELAPLSPVSRLTGGIVVEDVTVIGADSRRGSLFVMRNPRQSEPGPFDQKAEILTAFEKGAVAAITDLPLDELDPTLPLIGVQDRRAALVALGDAGRTRLQGRMIGITGSIGKSTTKDVLGQMLSFFGASFTTRGNYNEVGGVLMTLASMPSRSDFATIEACSVNLGSMERKARHIKPHVAVLTTIGHSHAANYAERYDILRDKAVLLEHLEPGGIAVVGRDVIEMDRARDNLLAALPCRILSVGDREDDDIRLVETKITPISTAVTARIDGRDYHTVLPVAGRQFTYATLFSLGVAHALELDLAEAAEALTAFEKPGTQRGARWKVDVGRRGDVVEVIDDSQNSAPQSVRALMEYLALRKPKRKWLVLGDMLELGPDEAALHLDLEDDIRTAGIDQLITVGPLSGALADKLSGDMGVTRLEDSLSAARFLFRNARQGDLIALKASGGIELRTVLQRLSPQSARRMAMPRWCIEDQAEGKAVS